MNRVEAYFEAELPFWLCMDDGDYDILIDGKPCLATGKPWKITLLNDMWLIAMGNELDGTTPLIAIAPSKDAKKYNKILPNQPYYHKRKLRTILRMGWGWDVKEPAKKEAEKVISENWNWCTQSFVKSVNQFIDIYRTSDTKDKVPTPLGEYDLSFNWWHTLFLNGDVIRRVRLGFDAYPVIMNPPLKTNNDVQKEIVNKLKSDYSPQSWKLIFENGAGLHRRGKHRMAILETYIGFELFLIEFIRKKFEKMGYKEDLINYLMYRPELNNMLTNGLKLSIGKPFHKIDNDLWSLWDNQKNGVRRTRHKIIHKGRIDISKDESEKAIKVIGNMIKKIKEM